MDSLCDMEDWEVPVFEIRDYTYKLIDTMGIENVRMLRERALETSLNGRDEMLRVYKGEVLNNHVAVTKRVTAWRSEISVAQSHALSVHPANSTMRRPSIVANMTGGFYYITLLGTPRYDGKKETKERNVPWHYMRQDPRHEPKDWADFLRSKRDDETQHHGASRDEPTNNTRTLCLNFTTSSSDTKWPLPRDLLHFLPRGLDTKQAGSNLHAERFAQMAAYGQQRKIRRAASSGEAELVAIDFFSSLQ
ncbi:uncharacterized protein ARMOST_17408 [Armillaria ostoyae]|uniref:Uncharacterized protein n=1 Tax=Armillaria ostoyae TaxID=47428 RepID=A0A284RZ14_ARMOS|nr:uncharacterized protein ARMOST_17408 [Armillaria ostoyae]